MSDDDAGGFAALTDEQFAFIACGLAVAFVAFRLWLIRAPVDPVTETPPAQDPEQAH